jgi:fructose-bisphosphate aldolase class 1
MNAQELIDTASSLVAGDEGLPARDENNPTCNKRFARLGNPQTGEARRTVANTMPRWKADEHDNKYPATHETCGIAKKGEYPL